MCTPRESGPRCHGLAERNITAGSTLPAKSTSPSSPHGRAPLGPRSPLGSDRRWRKAEGSFPLRDDRLGPVLLRDVVHTACADFALVALPPHVSGDFPKAGGRSA